MCYFPSDIKVSHDKWASKGLPSPTIKGALRARAGLFLTWLGRGSPLPAHFYFPNMDFALGYLQQHSRDQRKADYSTMRVQLKVGQVTEFALGWIAISERDASKWRRSRVGFLIVRRRARYIYPAMLLVESNCPNHGLSATVFS